MVKDWSKLAKDLTGAMAEVRAGIPDVMKAFHGVAESATKDGALDGKTKELIAMAIGIAVRCDGCLAFHGRAAAKLGATREEVMEMIGMAVYMGGGPSVIYGAQALEAFDQFKE